MTVITRKERDAPLHPWPIRLRKINAALLAAGQPNARDFILDRWRAGQTLTEIVADLNAVLPTSQQMHAISSIGVYIRRLQDYPEP